MKTTEKLPTREDYMTDKVSFKDYYEAWAEVCGIGFQDSAMLPRIIKALKDGDEHLNTIPLGEWDSLALAGRCRTSPKLKEHNGESWSLCFGVCVLKAAARRDAYEAMSTK